MLARQCEADRDVFARRSLQAVVAGEAAVGRLEFRLAASWAASAVNATVAHAARPPVRLASRASSPSLQQAAVEPVPSR